MRGWLIATLLLMLGGLGCGGAETDIDEPSRPDLIEDPRIEDPTLEDPAIIPAATTEPFVDERSHIPLSTPLAYASAPPEITLGDFVHLDGRASTDDDGETLHFIWSVEQRPVGSFFELGEDAPISIEGEGLAAFLPDRVGTWGVGLVVDDGHTRSAQSFVHIRVMGPDERPVANATSSEDARVGETVTFDGSGSVNPLEHVEALEFYWEPAGLPEESRCLGTVDGIEGPELSFIPDVPGRYVFVLQVEAAGMRSEPTYVGVDVAP